MSLFSCYKLQFLSVDTVYTSLAVLCATTRDLPFEAFFYLKRALVRCNAWASAVCLSFYYGHNKNISDIDEITRIRTSGVKACDLMKGDVGSNPIGDGHLLLYWNERKECLFQMEGKKINCLYWKHVNTYCERRNSFKMLDFPILAGFFRPPWPTHQLLYASLPLRPF